MLAGKAEVDWQPALKQVTQEGRALATLSLEDLLLICNICSVLDSHIQNAHLNINPSKMICI